METKREVTFAVRRLVNLIRRLAEGGLGVDGHITPMQGRVIGYVTHHAPEPVYQRDLEREFQVRRSTASAILQTMEKSGLIKREPVPTDARLKRLVLTARAVAFHERFRRQIASVEAVIVDGVTPEEMETFFRVVGHFEQNLNDYIAQRGAEPRPHGCGEECT